MWCGWKRPLNPIKLDIHTGWLVKWPRRCIFDVLPFFCFSQLESRENYLDQLYGSIMSSSSRQVHSNSKCAFGRKILVFSWGPCWQNLLDIWCSFRAFWETHETSRAKCRFFLLYFWVFTTSHICCCFFLKSVKFSLMTFWNVADSVLVLINHLGGGGLSALCIKVTLWCANSTVVVNKNEGQDRQLCRAPSFHSFWLRSITAERYLNRSSFLLGVSRTWKDISVSLA